MTLLKYMPRALRIPIAGLVTALLLATTAPADAHAIRDETPRIAVVSAFAPELAILQGELEGASSQAVNGVAFTTGTLEGHDVVLFLSGISVVNAAMTVQLALDHFAIERIVFSGIAGGVDPGLNIGDVVIADRWGQYLEMLFAREVEDGGWMTMPFFEYPYANFGMMFPRSVTVLRPGAEAPETRFWFPVDEALLASADSLAGDVTLARCTAEDRCLEEAPEDRCRRLGRLGRRLHRQRGLPHLGLRDLRRAGAGHGERGRGPRGLRQRRALPRRSQPRGSGRRRRRREPDGGLPGPRGGQRGGGGQGAAQGDAGRELTAPVLARPPPPLM